MPIERRKYDYVLRLAFTLLIFVIVLLLARFAPAPLEQPPARASGSHLSTAGVEGTSAPHLRTPVVLPAPNSPITA